jgi:hypothetical protein
MLPTKLVLALKLRKDEFLLPVGVIQHTTLILAEGIAGQGIEGRLHRISLYNLCQALIFIINKASFKSFLKLQEIPY